MEPGIIFTRRFEKQAHFGLTRRIQLNLEIALSGVSARLSLYWSQSGRSDVGTSGDVIKATLTVLPRRAYWTLVLCLSDALPLVACHQQWKLVCPITFEYLTRLSPSYGLVSQQQVSCVFVLKLQTNSVFHRAASRRFNFLAGILADHFRAKHWALATPPRIDRAMLFSFQACTLQQSDGFRNQTDPYRTFTALPDRTDRIADSSSRNAVRFSSACTTKRFPSSRCASAIQIVRQWESIADRNRAGSRLLFLAEFLESGIGIRLTKFLRFTSYYLLGPTCSGPESSCWKSGRLRIGSQTGSIFKAAMDTAPPAGIESKCRSLLMASSGAPARASICASPIWKFGPARASFSMEIVSAACLERRSASALRPRAR